MSEIEDKKPTSICWRNKLLDRAGPPFDPVVPFSRSLLFETGAGAGADESGGGTDSVAPTITSADNSGVFLIGDGSPGAFIITTLGTPIVHLSETGDMPAGYTFVDNGNGTATISGSSHAVGTTTSIVITASNGVLPDATQNFDVIINPPNA